MGEDGSGLHSIYLRRGAGYYIDLGASQMIIDGRIKLKRDGRAVGRHDAPRRPRRLRHRLRQHERVGGEAHLAGGRR